MICRKLNSVTAISFVENVYFKTQNFQSVSLDRRQWQTISDNIPVQTRLLFKILYR